MSEEPRQGIELFYCYARADRTVRDEIDRHLSRFKRQFQLISWHDLEINAGTEWDREISNHLNKAQIILLLVSPNFMASDYCWSIEMKRALEKHAEGSASVIPIILRSVDWEDAPFSKLQALPSNGKPITNWQDRDDALYDIAREIRKTVIKLLAPLPAKVKQQAGIKDQPDTSKSISTNAPFSGTAGWKVVEDITHTLDILAPHILDEIIRRSLEIRLSDIQLAQEAHGNFLSHVLNHVERRSNYRCHVYMTNVQSEEIATQQAYKYYEGYIDVSYETVLVKDTFRFTSVARMEEYEELLKDPNWELRWVAERTRDYSPQAAFKVEFVIVNGLELNIRKENAKGRLVIIADHPGLQAMQEKPATVHYRYTVKIKKRGHLLMIHVPCPTHNVAVELDYGHTDIDFVNVLDFFASHTKPNIHFIPTRHNSRKIGVEVHGWVFPKGGVVFVWVLRAEKHPGFWRLSPDPGSMNPLRPLLAETADDSSKHPFN